MCVQAPSVLKIDLIAGGMEGYLRSVTWARGVNPEYQANLIGCKCLVTMRFDLVALEGELAGSVIKRDKLQDCDFEITKIRLTGPCGCCSGYHPLGPDAMDNDCRKNDTRYSWDPDDARERHGCEVEIFDHTLDDMEAEEEAAEGKDFV